MQRFGDVVHLNVHEHDLRQIEIHVGVGEGEHLVGKVSVHARLLRPEIGEWRNGKKGENYVNSELFDELFFVFTNGDELKDEEQESYSHPPPLQA